MCLLIAKNAGKTIPLEYLENGFSENPDGAGFAWADGEKVRIEKGFESFKSFFKRWQKVSAEFPALVHFRWATHGEIARENCHPFTLPNGWAMAHNGVIPGFGSKTESDTRAFLGAVVSPAVQQSPLVVRSKKFREELARHIGHSKLAFLEPSGEIHLVRGDLGHWVGGVWYSNDSYLPQPIWEPKKWWEPEPKAQAPEDAWDIIDVLCESCCDPLKDGWGYREKRSGRVLCPACWGPE